jgi:hypothetical protein
MNVSGVDRSSNGRRNGATKPEQITSRPLGGAAMEPALIDQPSDQLVSHAWICVPASKHRRVHTILCYDREWT